MDEELYFFVFSTVYYLYEKYIKFKNREIRKAISDNSKIFNYNEEDI
jgi:hypothetical protein